MKTKRHLTSNNRKKHMKSQHQKVNARRQHFFNQLTPCEQS